MAVEPYADGFLLSEVPLGEGFLDIRGMVALLRNKDANMPFDLEMITRDPLKIPVFTDKYWVTFDDSYSPLPGRDLARTLEIVNKNKPKTPLPHTTGMIRLQLKTGGRQYSEVHRLCAPLSISRSWCVGHICQVVSPVAPHMPFFRRREGMFDLVFVERIV